MALSLDKQILAYSLIIAIIASLTLSMQILSILGVIVSKNAAQTTANTQAIKTINDHIVKSQLGTTKSATYNLTAANSLLLKEILNIVQNQSKLR